MGYKVRQFQDTPNPNALKCILDRRISEKPRSYFKPEDAASDPVGSSLFAIPGVTNILINADWITISRAPGSDWKAIKAGVQKVLNEA